MDTEHIHNGGNTLGMDRAQRPTACTVVVISPELSSADTKSRAYTHRSSVYAVDVVTKDL